MTSAITIPACKPSKLYSCLDYYVILNGNIVSFDPTVGLFIKFETLADNEFGIETLLTSFAIEGDISTLQDQTNVPLKLNLPLTSDNNYCNFRIRATAGPSVDVTYDKCFIYTYTGISLCNGLV